MTLVELEHDRRHGIAAARKEAPRELIRERRMPQALDFERKQSDFLGGIEQTQRTVELEAVDDRDGRSEMYVFRPQIPVPFDHTRTACCEHARRRPDECELRSGDLVHEPLG